MVGDPVSMRSQCNVLADRFRPQSLGYSGDGKRGSTAEQGVPFSEHLPPLEVLPSRTWQSHVIGYLGSHNASNALVVQVPRSSLFDDAFQSSLTQAQLDVDEKYS